MRRADHDDQGMSATVLDVLREGGAFTRSDLAERTGQARMTVGHRLGVLERAGLVRVAPGQVATGGRPSTAYEFAGTTNHVLAVDLGARHVTCAVADLHGTVLQHTTDEVSVAEGPVPVLDLVHRRLRRLVETHPGGTCRIRAVGLGLPGPVDGASGRPTSPPIMPGWDGVDVPGQVRRRWDRPVFVDNDANVLALGERATAHPDVDDLIYVKVATGIGAGVVSAGRLLHGADGAAGDLGHVHCPEAGSRRCRCGNTGCLETLAGGTAMVAELAAAGLDVTSPADVVRLARRGDLTTLRTLRTAGRALGGVLATCTALFNPRVIVLGGEVTAVGEPLLAGVREVVHQRALPLASRDLRLAVAAPGPLGGVAGASRLAIDRLLAPAHLAQVTGAAVAV